MTVLKCAFADLCNAVGNFDILHCVTKTESIVTDSFYSFGNHNGFQGLTAAECAISNRRDRLWKGNGSDFLHNFALCLRAPIFIVMKCLITDRRYRVFTDSLRNDDFGFAAFVIRDAVRSIRQFFKAPELSKFCRTVGIFFKLTRKLFFEIGL